MIMQHEALKLRQSVVEIVAAETRSTRGYMFVYIHVVDLLICNCIYNEGS